MLALRNKPIQNRLLEIKVLTVHKALKRALTMELSERSGEEIQVQRDNLVNMINQTLIAKGKKM